VSQRRHAPLRVRGKVNGQNQTNSSTLPSFKTKHDSQCSECQGGLKNGRLYCDCPHGRSLMRQEKAGRKAIKETLNHQLN